MIHRCYNPKSSSWDNYGNRGIKVCERWINSYYNFYNDRGKRPSAKYSIHRINNDGDYCPENCKWATKKEQSSNRRKPKQRKNKLGDHEMQNVFVHEDGIVSTPFCNSGNSIIYAWFNGKYPPSEVTQCKCNKCTCHINSPIERKGNELEKLEFWK